MESFPILQSPIGELLGTNFSLTIPSNLISISPLPVLGGIGIYVYSTRPKIIEKKETAHFINSEVDLRVYEYSFTVWWGWNWLPWHKIPQTSSISALKVLPDTELEFYYIPRSSKDEFLPAGCIKKQLPVDGKIEVLLKDRIFFIKETIETVYLITRDKEKSDYRSNISTSFYPNSDNNPSMIKMTNKNKVMIKNYVCKFDEQQTENIIKRHSDYTRYLRVHSQNVADCLIEDKKLIVIINEIPKHSAGIDGIATVNLD